MGIPKVSRSNLAFIGYLGGDIGSAHHRKAHEERRINLIGGDVQSMANLSAFS